MKRLEAYFVEEFWDDLELASTYYEEQVPGLGQSFEQAIWASTRSVQDYPEAFKQIRGPYRIALVRRFNHLVIYAIHNDYIEFKGLVHGMRDLPRWLNRRLEDE